MADASLSAGGLPAVHSRSSPAGAPSETWNNRAGLGTHGDRHASPAELRAPSASPGPNVDADEFASRVRIALALHGEVGEEVVAALIDAVPETSRAAVLARVQRALATTQPEFNLEPAPDLDPDDPARELVQEVDAFVLRLESGHYFRGLEWDELRREERSFGDETWAREMDRFLGRAATVYWGGNESLAVHLYARLLGAFRHEGKVGVFCGPEPASRMVESDLGEARRRYLRALLRTVDGDSRITRFVAEFVRLRDVGEGELNLTQLVTGDEDGPGLADPQAFGQALSAWLAGVDRENHANAREMRRLSREAVMLADGMAGLVRLARMDGASHPEAWHDWVGSLVRAGDLHAAALGAREALNVLSDTTYRARMADRLVGLAARLGQPEVRLGAARTALRTSPTETRLLQFVAAARAANAPAALDLEAGEAVRPGSLYPEAIAARVLLLAGRLEDALARFQRADSVGWGRKDHAATVVLPALCLCLGVERRPGTVVARLWDELDGPAQGYFDRRLLLDRIAADDEPEPEVEPLSALLEESLRQHGLLNGGPVTIDPRVGGRKTRVPSGRILGFVEAKLDASARELVRSHQRRAQVTAAVLLATLAEILTVTTSPETAKNILKSGRKLAAPASAFAEALESLRLGSPILTPGRS